METMEKSINLPEEKEVQLNEQQKEEWRLRMANAHLRSAKNALRKQFKKEFGINFSKQLVSERNPEEENIIDTGNDKEESLDSALEKPSKSSLEVEPFVADLNRKKDNDNAEENVEIDRIDNPDLSKEAKAIDDKKKSVVEDAGKKMEETAAKTKRKSEKRSDKETNFIDYRKHLDKLRTKVAGMEEGQIKYSRVENITNDFGEELERLFRVTLDDKDMPVSLEEPAHPLLTERAGSLILPQYAESLTPEAFEKLSIKIGLSVEEIKEVIQNQREALLAEAKQEVASSTPRLKKVAKVLGKSGLYIGAGVLAGTTAAATLGIGGLAGVGIISSARILDRYLTERKNQKKIEDKLLEIREKKQGDKDFKAETIKKMATALSLKKRLAVERVSLGEDKARDRVITEYISDQAPSELSGKELREYKDKMFKALKGLDDIDKLNQKEEDKLANNSKRFDKIKKIENKIFGETAGEKTVSSAVLAGLGVAARSMPGLEKVLLAYSGWRIGGVIGDAIANKQINKKKASDRKPEADLGKDNSELYVNKRKQLLDRDLLKNNPELYRELKEQADSIESAYINFVDKGLEELNSDLEKELDKKISVSRKARLIKTGSRVGGAVLMALGGSLATDLLGQNAHQNVKEHAEKILNRHSHDKSGLETVVGSGKTNNPAEVDASHDNLGAAHSIDTTKTESVTVGAKDEVPASLHKGVEQVTPHSQTEEFSDKISNAGLHGKHDSVWRSTREIFEKHADKLGYKGDLNDKAALDKWAETQTANAIHHSGDIKDKVFEGNKVILEKHAGGGYEVKVEKDAGLAPGHLPDQTIHREAPMQELKPQGKDSVYANYHHQETTSQQFHDAASRHLAEKYGLDPSKYSDGGQNLIMTNMHGHDVFFNDKTHEIFVHGKDGSHYSYGDLYLQGGAHQEEIESAMDNVSKNLDGNLKMLDNNGFSPHDVVSFNGKGSFTANLDNRDVFLDLNKHTVDCFWRGHKYTLPFTPGKNAKESVENLLQERAKIEGAAENLQGKMLNDHLRFGEIRRQLKIVNGGQRLRGNQLKGWRNLYRGIKEFSKGGGEHPGSYFATIRSEQKKTFSTLLNNLMRPKK